MGAEHDERFAVRVVTWAADEARLRAVRLAVFVVEQNIPEELYDAEVRPLPSERHDRTVDAVATPTGWHRLKD